MIVLKETSASQSFSFIPRLYECDTLVLVNETTSEETIYDVGYTIDRYYLVIDKILDLKENNFYQMTVKNGDAIIYKDKVFCTNQVIEDFTVNKDAYTDYPTTNEYITYE